MTLSLVNDNGYSWNHCGAKNDIVKTTWNFPYFKPRTKEKVSTFFYTKENSNHVNWKLQLQVKSEKQNASDDISHLYIALLHFYYSKNQGTIIGDPDVLVKFAIVDSQGQKRFKKLFLSPAKSKSVEFFLAKNDIMNSKCQLPDGSLTIYFKIQRFVKIEEDVRNTDISFAKPINFSDQLGIQLEGLLDDAKFSDVTFVLRGQELKAHKNILASRSKVFETMFKLKTNRFVIEDIEPNVFQVLLRFIYTGKVSVYDVEKFAVGLYKAADIYLLDQLKIQCENHLIRRPMSADYCIESLLFISNHPSAEKLKQEAIKFFRLYPLEVMETEGWKKAKNENKPWLSGILKFLLHPAEDTVQFPQQINEQSSSKRKR